VQTLNGALHVIKRAELAAYLSEYLDCGRYQDYAPNGIQVEGRDSIQQICTAVTASEEIIQKAAVLQADVILVHHGYFWKGEAPVVTGMKRRRIGALISHDMNLFAYHLPLDCHADVGNNACLAELLEVEAVTKHCAGKIDNILWSGVLPIPQNAQEFSQYLTHKLKKEPLLISGTSRPICRIAWCTGAAQDFIEDAYALGADAYLSGEVSERTYYQAQELGIHYYACGHHATERYGIQALGNHLSVRFNLRHQFIDTANPI
jgi:dinuclear metal center YbgI/SA1388 family protein